MLLKQDNHIFTGLQLDIDILKVTPNYLIDAHNIRLTAIENGTLLSITNERGPKALDNLSLQGTFIGGCILNEYYVLFTHTDTVDYIYRIDLSGSGSVTTLYSKGLLGFSKDYPIGAIPSYENEDIQKVYWTDSLNQPRIINIAPSNDGKITSYTSTSFDFCPELSLGETITVTKAYGAGSFSPGVIQWAFTYYNLYRQESAIFYTTPLYYITHYGRGAAPEDTCNNTFTIKVSGLDTKFDYLRIYSIQRTSINGTPICKRLLDIDLSNSPSSVSFIDTGTKGETIDPTELLYKGGETITSETMCQKDGTLFLGNIKIDRPAIPTSIKTSILGSTSSPIRINGSWDLTTPPSTTINSEYDFFLDSANCARFKRNEYYRLGVLFLYKTGQWSDPIWIGDSLAANANTTYRGQPYYECSPFTSKDSVNTLIDLGYKKIRGVIASPSNTDRTILAQGVVNGTLYRPCDRYGISDSLTELPSSLDPSNGTIFALSSWLFRPQYSAPSKIATTSGNYGGYISCYPEGELTSVFTDPRGALSSSAMARNLRSTEIGGFLYYTGRFFNSTTICTLNSPEILWDTSLLVLNYYGKRATYVGYIIPNANYGDEDITMESSTGSGDGKGFQRRAFKTDGNAALMTLLCYSDSMLDDVSNIKTDTPRPYGGASYPTLWPVYLWHGTVSLNNDINRDSQSALIKTKKISNYKYAPATYLLKSSLTEDGGYSLNPTDIQCFNSTELSMLKLKTSGGTRTYYGNIDTSIGIEKSPVFLGGKVFNGSGEETVENGTWSVTSSDKWDTVHYDSDIRFCLVEDTSVVKKWDGWGEFTGDWSHRLCVFYYVSSENRWYIYPSDGNIGDYYKGFTSKNSPIRMRYKLTPHLVLNMSISNSYVLYQEFLDDKRYPSTYSYPLFEIRDTYNKDTLYGGTSEDALKAIDWIVAGEPVTLLKDTLPSVIYIYGDTYLLRWDCLKTYPWSLDDVNLLVDIMSFNVESHINMDGRYDRNRGQHSNLNVSPSNYNLLNPVYSLLDNFFSYKILDDNYYDLDTFPNQIAWSTLKNSGVEVDPWCLITLASTYDLDGSKGAITNLDVWNDTIYCFLDHGISNILFNSRVQIPTSLGVPIEISNNYKVEGKRYISDGVGSSNKYSTIITPSGIYFIDSITNDLYHIGSTGLTDVSLTKSMSTYFNTLNINKWTPSTYTTKVFYNGAESELYVTSSENCLNFSERLGEFTSFMSYEGLSDMFNINLTFYGVKQNASTVSLYKMFAGDYNSFFGTYKPYDFTFISNGRNSEGDTSTLNKYFTNLNFRADKWDTYDSTLGDNTPFDYLRVWNEYLDTGTKALTFERVKQSNLKEKFRVWRAIIPRDKTHTRDRISNPWCKIKLGINTPSGSTPDTKYFNLHDMSVLYYI